VTFVPQAIGDAIGSSLLLVDFPADWTGQAVADSTGTASILTEAAEPGFYWRVERQTTLTTDSSDNLVTPPAGANLMVYKGTVASPIAFRDGSQAPGLDVADQSQPITLRPGEQLLFQWTGLAAGTIAYATVQYSLYQRVAGQ